MASTSFSTSISLWRRYPALVYNIDLRPNESTILERLDAAGPPVSEQCEVRFGVKVYQKGKGRPPQSGREAHGRIFDSATRKTRSQLPYLWGEHISRFAIASHHRWIDYGPHLAEPRSLELFRGPRVLVRRIVGTRLVVTPVLDTFIADQLIHTVKPLGPIPDVCVLAGILGSRLIAFYFRRRFNRSERTFPEIRVAELRAIPLPHVGGPQRDRLVAVVQRMLELNKRLAGAKTAHEQNVIQRDIETTDRQIDRLVYDLYGLTEEEVGVVEEGAG